MPRRWRPEVEIGADEYAAHAEIMHQEAGDEVLGLDLGEGRIEGQDDDAVEPHGIGEARLGSPPVRRNMKGAGAKTSRGCGSKVSMSAGAPAARARESSAARMDWCPRWTPFEIADGHIGAAQGSGEIGEASEASKAQGRGSCTELPRQAREISRRRGRGWGR